MCSSWKRERTLLPFWLILTLLPFWWHQCCLGFAISAVGAIVAIDAIVAIVPLFGQTCLQYHGNWKVSTENRRQTSFAQFCYLQLRPISFSFQAIAMALEDSFSSLIHAQPKQKPKISLLKFLGIQKNDCF